MQVDSNGAQQRIDLLERFVIQASLFQITVHDGETLPDNVVNTGTHAQVRGIVGNFFDLFDLHAKLFCRKLEQMVRVDVYKRQR